MLGFLVLSNLYRIGQYFNLGFLSKLLPILLVTRLNFNISKGILLIILLYFNLYLFSLPFSSIDESLYEMIKSHSYVIMCLLYFDNMQKDGFKRIFLLSSTFGAMLVVFDAFGLNIYSSYPEEIELFARYRAIGNYLNPNAFGLLVALTVLMYDDSKTAKPIKVLIALIALVGLLTFSKWYLVALLLIVLRKPFRLLAIGIVGVFLSPLLVDLINSFSGINRVLGLFTGSVSMNDVTTNRSQLLSSALSDDLSVYGRGLTYASNDFGHGEGVHNMFVLNLLNGGYLCLFFYCVLLLYVSFLLIRKGMLVPLILIFSLNFVSHNLLDSVVFPLGLLYFLKYD